MSEAIKTVEKATSTPGPWIAERARATNFVGVYSDDATGSIIAQVGGFQFARRSLDAIMANARLIAAAPDLLAALKSYAGLFDNPVYRRRLADSSLYEECVECARAAIAKVEG